MFRSALIWSRALPRVIVLGLGSRNWIVSVPDPGVVQPFEARSVFAALIASRRVHCVVDVSALVVTVIVVAAPAEPVAACPASTNVAVVTRTTSARFVIPPDAMA